MDRSRGNITHEALLEAIAALGARLVDPERVHQVELEVEALRHEVTHLAETVVQATSKETKRDTCPFRDALVGAEDHEERIDALEQDRADMRVEIAKTAGGAGAQAGAKAGGIIGAVLAVGIDALLRAGRELGWW